MPEQDPRAAAQQRDRGLRRVGRITWRAGASGVAGAAVVAVAFGHHSSTPAAPAGHPREHSSIVIPAQPPKPATGSSQVTSGAS